jgi:hypothetical protein
VKLEPEFSIYLDRSGAESLPDNIHSELNIRGLIAENRLKKVSFCGILMVNGGINVFLPRSSEHSHLPKKNQISMASLTLKAVEKYWKEKNTRIDLKDEPDGSQGLSQLSLIRKLLDDFRQYGIYSRRKVIKKINSSRPDWKRTITKSSPFKGLGGAPVYLDVHCIQKRYFSDTEVSLIHAKIINQIDQDFSWIVSGRLGLIAPELNDYPTPVSNINHQIHLLKSELNQIYAERDIVLLKDLINYLENFSGRQGNNFIAGVKDFHFVWEHMLRQVLENKVELNSQLPAPAYNDVNGNIHTANQKSMRTDIILEDKPRSIVAIVDAKYYAATSPENSPGWPDLVKQFFYAKAMKLLRPSSTIRNYFVFPNKKSYLLQARLRDRFFNNNHFYDDEFAPVDCIYVCPVEVLHHYTTGKKMTHLSKKLLS